MQTIAREIKQSQSTKASRFRKIVLAGNPNVGKSVIFNALTGMSADVSNYPGTTIDIARGQAGEYELVDTPGAYGVSSFNDEERAARRLILEADAIVNVVSALSLDRDLFLTLQLIDMGKPVLLVINQWDEAMRRGLKIDVAQISQLLDIPVLTCVAVARQGIERIMLEVEQARVGKFDKRIYEIISPLCQENIPQAYALLIAEGDQASAEEYHREALAERGNIYKLRRARANEVVAQTVNQETRKQSFSVKLGRVLLHPIYGSIIACAVCYFLFYQVLGVFIAGNLVDLTEKKGMRVYWEPLVRRTCATILPADITIGDSKFVFPNGTLSDASQNQKFEQALAATKPDEVKYNFWPRLGIKEFIGTSIAGEYGVLTLTVTYLLGLLMPLVLGFYLGLSLLEDSGYLPRLAVLVDRVMMKMGLNGRAIIPLILGLGCVTMATITTRLLTSKREKLIATALLGVAIPCSAQLGVVSGTLARSGGMVAWAIYGVVVATILGVTGLLLNMVLPGQSGSLVIDLPPMRMPRMDNVLKKTWSKSWNFLMESIPMFALAGFVVTIAQVTGVLDFFIACLRPVTVNWLNLPSDPRVATTFILGIVRRDFAAFGLTDVAMTTAQAVVAMVVITLFVPCIATVGVMIKERGLKVAMVIWLGSWLAAFAIGGALAHVLPLILH